MFGRFSVSFSQLAIKRQEGFSVKRNTQLTLFIIAFLIFIKYKLTSVNYSQRLSQGFSDVNHKSFWFSLTIHFASDS